MSKRSGSSRFEIPEFPIVVFEGEYKEALRLYKILVPRVRVISHGPIHGTAIQQIRTVAKYQEEARRLIEENQVAGA